MSKKDKFDNYIIYKTFGIQRLSIILLIRIFFALLAKKMGKISNLRYGSFMSS